MTSNTEENFTNQLKDILFIYCSLVLFSWFILASNQTDKQISKLNSDLLLAKTIAVELYEERNTNLEMVNSMNDYANSLELELQKYKHLEKFKKELDRSTEK